MSLQDRLHQQLKLAQQKHLVKAIDLVYEKDRTEYKVFFHDDTGADTVHQLMNTLNSKYQCMTRFHIIAHALTIIVPLDI